MTENNSEEPVEVAVEPQTPTPTKRGLRRPGRLDPGWATLVAAALALVGTLATVFYRGSGDDPKAQTTVVESTTAKTETSAAKTSTPSDPPTSTSTTSTSAPPAGPSVSLLSALPADQREVVNAAAVQILAVADKLPLMVHDEFANNDYAWPQSSQTFDGGIQCSWTVGQGAYDMAVHSVNGPAYCQSGLSKVASGFVLTVEQHLRDERNSDIGILFRYTDDQNHYAVVYNQQTQLMSLTFVGPDGESPILAPTFVAELNRSGSNQITLLATGPLIFVYVNETLVVGISNETRITSAGRILIREWLNEPNADEVLSLTRYELRGS